MSSIAGGDPHLRRSISEVDDDTLRWALDLARFVRHPVFVGTLFSGLLVAVGIVIMAISAFGVNDQFYVSLQLPYLISGGFGALSLMVLGAFLSSILGDRRDGALADAEMADVLGEIAAVSRLAVRRRANQAGTS
ncbi:MAG: hypothetical protein WB767_05395 [Nocardioides sp.]